LIKNKKDETLPKLERFMRLIKRALAENGIVNFHTDYRQKGLYSLSQKINRKDGNIDKIYDILALRIFTENISDCYKVLGIIHNKWRPIPGRIKDYIAMPKANGYQSLHTTVFTGDGAIVEVQIRTHDMHNQAEYGVASHLTYKDARYNQGNDNKEMGWFSQFLPKSLQNYFHPNHKNVPDWMKDLAEQNKSNDGEEMLENLKADFFSERIFVFTPKGDVIDLPLGSSVIDFAYNIHSDIGNHMASAMINHKIASLHTILKNGDQIEIITKKSAKPHRKWLDYTKTSIAKKFIRSTLNIKTD
jgi:GTP pyrophosphokinase